MDKKQIKKRILEEEDYIRYPKYSNSLIKFLGKYPDGIENSTIARILLMSEEEVEKIYQEAVEMLKEKMG